MNAESWVSPETERVPLTMVRTSGTIAAPAVYGPKMRKLSHAIP